MSELQQREVWESAVLESVRSLRFGSVVVVVHDGKVTQIEKREKIRPEDRPSGKQPEQTPTLTGRHG